MKLRLAFLIAELCINILEYIWWLFNLDFYVTDFKRWLKFWVNFNNFES